MLPAFHASGSRFARKAIELDGTHPASYAVLARNLFAQGVATSYTLPLLTAIVQATQRMIHVASTAREPPTQRHDLNQLYVDVLRCTMSAMGKLADRVHLSRRRRASASAVAVVSEFSVPTLVAAFQEAFPLLAEHAASVLSLHLSGLL